VPVLQIFKWFVSVYYTYNKFLCPHSVICVFSVQLVFLQVWCTPYVRKTDGKVVNRVYIAKKVLSYVFFWDVLWCMKFSCQRFGTRCLFHLHRWVGMKMEQSVPKCWELNFICRRTSQTKPYDIQNMAKVWNQEKEVFSVHENVTLSLQWPFKFKIPRAGPFKNLMKIAE
jgi:hypothetical protein